MPASATTRSSTGYIEPTTRCPARRSRRCARIEGPRSSAAPRSRATDRSGFVHWVYLAILAGCVLGTLPLELLLRVRVYARWRRLLATLVPVVMVFAAWDILQIRAGAWRYDPAYL